MYNPSFRTFVRNYIKYRKIRRRITKVYYSRLIKASLLISTVPLIMVAILIIYGRLTPEEGMFAAIAVFFGSTFFAKPYLADLSSLTHYVEQLALDKKADAPLLSYLGNVEELSSAVRNLHRSWGQKKIKLEAALAESKILFDTLPDILLMLDNNLNVVRANNIAFIKLDQSTVGHHIQNIFEDEEVIDTIEEVQQTGIRNNIGTSIITHNVQRDYTVHIERFPVESAGSIAIVLILHDVTESKKTKQMMKDFVANASHEIRTPLTSISGFIETMQSMAPEDEETRQHFLSIMAEQTGHMGKLVEDLLCLSKAEMSENTIPTEEVNILDILEKSIRSSTLLAKNKNITVHYKRGKELPIIIGDARELEQVFINLISNAIKYSPNDTNVTVKATKRNDEIRLSFQDEGDGIAKEDISRITERFFRVDKVRSRKVGGTGIGLAIVKHILNRHKAHLDIKSTFGKGSRFTVILPTGIEEA